MYVIEHHKYVFSDDEGSGVGLAMSGSDKMRGVGLGVISSRRRDGTVQASHVIAISVPPGYSLACLLLSYVFPG